MTKCIKVPEDIEQEKIGDYIQCAKELMENNPWMTNSYISKLMKESKVENKNQDIQIGE